MTDQSIDDRADDSALPGFGQPDVGSSESVHGWRTLWISVAALAAIAAAAAPVVTHFLHRPQKSLTTPARLAGLTLDESADAMQTADYLRTAIAAGMGLSTSVGAVYTDGRGDSHSVIFIGGTDTHDDTDSAKLTSLFGLLHDNTDGFTGIIPENAGSLGGVMRCGLTTDTSPADRNQPVTEMAVCGWADNRSVGIGLFPNRTIVQAAELLRQMRSGIQGNS